MYMSTLHVGVPPSTPMTNGIMISTQHCIFQCCLWFTCTTSSKSPDSYSSKEMSILAFFWVIKHNFTCTQPWDIGSDIFEFFDLMSEYLFNEYTYHDSETRNGIRAKDSPQRCLSSLDLVKCWEKCVRDYSLLNHVSRGTLENTTHSILDQITWTKVYSGTIHRPESISEVKRVKYPVVNPLFTKQGENISCHIISLTTDIKVNCVSKITFGIWHPFQTVVEPQIVNHGIQRMRTRLC